MNQKIEKLRTERGKNEKIISKMQARNKEIDGLITEYENTDIVGFVRSSGMTLDPLAALLRGAKDAPAPETYDEEETLNEE